MNKCLLTLNVELMIDQSNNTTSVYLGELIISFIGFAYRTMGEGLLAVEEMTQREYCQKSTSACVTAYKGWKPKTQLTATGWKESLIAELV